MESLLTRADSEGRFTSSQRSYSSKTDGLLTYLLHGAGHYLKS